MLITFAVPREIGGVKFAPDQTADLPGAVAKTLLHDGHARRAVRDDRTVTDGLVEAVKAERDALNLDAASVETPAQSTIIDSPTPGDTEQE